MNNKPNNNEKQGGEAPVKKEFKDNREFRENRERREPRDHSYKKNFNREQGQKPNYPKREDREGNNNTQKEFTPYRENSRSASQSRNQRIKQLETVEDITLDISRIEKEIEIEIKELRNIRL